jgi:hypothetical protein
MTKDELVASLALGAMATLTLVLVWGRRLVDLVPVWAWRLRNPKAVCSFPGWQHKLAGPPD